MKLSIGIFILVLTVRVSHVTHRSRRLSVAPSPPHTCSSPQLFSVCITSGDRTEALSFDQRIDSLVKSVTQLVVTHVSRALRPTHRLAFTTALCAAVAAEQGTLKHATWSAILDPNCYDEVSIEDDLLA